MHDIIHNIGLSQVAAPQVMTSAPVTGAVIDTQGIGTLAVAVLLGAAADTLGVAVYIDLKIEHADDDGTGNPAAFTPCTDADVLPDMTLSSGVFKRIDSNAEANMRYALEYRGEKRFVKVSAVPAGLEDGAPIAMIALCGNPAQKPVDND
ncbi:MAG: hypothetical protein Q8K65_00445 [Alphaproteobacteria bacterium]|nr:hypothetical protein [Alphaproteobacteria bacterium]